MEAPNATRGLGHCLRSGARAGVSLTSTLSQNQRRGGTVDRMAREDLGEEGTREGQQGSQPRGDLGAVKGLREDLAIKALVGCREGRPLGHGAGRGGNPMGQAAGTDCRDWKPRVRAGTCPSAKRYAHYVFLQRGLYST